METGAITSHIDVAQIVLYAFWIFFAGLIWYLRREDRREGYPLEADVPGTGRRSSGFLFLWIPPPKTFLLPHGGTAQAPSDKVDTREIKARRTAAWPGAPLEPTGDPMLDGVGPAAYAEREDVPERMWDGQPMIVPMRVEGEASIAAGDADPRGMTVLGADGKVAGTVSDIWLDRAEPQIRYLEVEVPLEAGARRVLLPIHYARIDSDRRQVKVQSILARHFATVPGTQSSEQVTKLEEDRITAYYASGNLYATPDRLEPLL